MVEEESKTVSFRVSAEEYRHMERIAGILSQNKQIRNDSVGAMAKALVFVKVNEFIQIELMQKDIDEREQALKARNIPTQGYGHL